MADDPAADPAQTTLLRRWWAVAGLALFGATWKLWTPQTEFPQVPLLGRAGSLPVFWDWTASGILLGSLATAAWNPISRRSWLAFSVSLGVLMLLDQHRLQPWAWQLLLMAIWWNSTSERRHSNLPCIALTISIYFWSAVSKLDAGFAASHGQTLIAAMFRSVGINAVNWPASVKSWLAFSLPVGELLVAVGLSWSRTRQAALIAATALHVGLILALGPLGLGHRPGVLLWNLAFIGHDWLLFGGRACRTCSATQSVSERMTAPTRLDAAPSGQRDSKLTTMKLAIRVSLLVFVCVWPMTEHWGLCDRWLAWSVYSSRSERVSVLFNDDGLRRLPESARRCVVDGELPLDRWSLTALDVPIYPQLRFQFGVVEWLRQCCGDDNLVEVIVQHSQAAERGIERLAVGQLDERRRTFWINTQPRPEFSHSRLTQ